MPGGYADGRSFTLKPEVTTVWPWRMPAAARHAGQLELAGVVDWRTPGKLPASGIIAPTSVRPSVMNATAAEFELTEVT